MSFLKSKFSWLAAPILWFSAVSFLFLLWAFNYPCPQEWISKYIDHDGASFIEAATIGLFVLQLVCIWVIPPMKRGWRRVFWQTDFSLITLIAVCREMDWHKAWIQVSNLPGATTGTPFKMRFLTNPVNPLRDRLLVLACFVVVFAVCGFTLFYFLRRLIKGLFSFHPVCWSVAFLGGTCVLIQFVDRIPSILRKKFHCLLSAPVHALFQVLEEGQEVLLPLFVILALLQAYWIYVSDTEDASALIRFREEN